MPDDMKAQGNDSRASIKTPDELREDARVYFSRLVTDYQNSCIL